MDEPPPLPTSAPPPALPEDDTATTTPYDDGTYAYGTTNSTSTPYDGTYTTPYAATRKASSSMAVPQPHRPAGPANPRLSVGARPAKLTPLDTDGWKAALDADGNMYFYQESTGESKWELDEPLKSAVMANFKMDSGDRLISLVMDQNLEDAEKLVQANPLVVDYAQPSTGRTALWFACAKKRNDIVQALIRAGANINKSDDHMVAPIYIAAQKGDLSIVKTLTQTGGCNINQPSQDSTTPLYIAAEKGHHTVVEYLLKQGANVNQAKHNGCTPLWAAAAAGKDQVVTILLQSFANPLTPGLRGKTPLDMAKMQRHTNLVPILEDACKRFTPTNDGHAPVVQSMETGAGALSIPDGVDDELMSSASANEWHAYGGLFCFRNILTFSREDVGTARDPKTGKMEPQMGGIQFSDMCGYCFEAVCVVGCFPCVAAGDVWSRDLGPGHTDPPGNVYPDPHFCADSVWCGCLYCLACPCCMSFALRESLTDRWHIEESTAETCFHAICCLPCSLAQMEVELDYRGVASKEWC